MKKITMKSFEELIARDEALTAKAKELSGEGDALKEKVSAFAASLGYDLDFGEESEENGSKVQKIDSEELEKIAGGLPDPKKTVICKKKGHDYVFLRREKGTFWGYNAYYKCRRCGAQMKVWE